MFLDSPTFKSTLLKNIKSIQPDEERAYFYIQESKAKDPKQCFFIEKQNKTFLAFSKVSSINKRLQKFSIEAFPDSSVFSAGTIRKDEKGTLNIEPQKKKSISGAKVIHALKKATDLRKYLKGIYLYLPQTKDESSASPPESTNPESAITQNIAKTNTELQQFVDENKRGIVNNITSALKTSREYISQIRDTLENAIDVLGSIRPLMQNGHIGLQLDADKLFELIDISDILEFDKDASENLLQIEIVQFPNKEIIIRTPPGKSIALKRITMGDTTLNSAIAQNLTLHVNQSTDGLDVNMSFDSLSGHSISGTMLTCEKFSLSETKIELSRTKDIVSASMEIGSSHVEDLSVFGQHLEAAVMQDTQILLAQSKKENRFSLYSADVHNEQMSADIKSHKTTSKTVDMEELNVDFSQQVSKPAYMSMDANNTHVQDGTYQKESLDLDVHAKSTTIDHVGMEAKIQNNENAQSIDLDIDTYNIQSEDITVQKADTSIHVDRNSMGSLSTSYDADGLRVDAAQNESHNIHVDVAPSSETSTQSPQEKARILEQMGELVDDAHIVSTIPLKDGWKKSILRGQKDTNIHINTDIEDGKLIPGKVYVHLDKAIKTPFLVSLKGAYLDRKGKLKANIKNSFDIGLNKQIAKALGIPQEELLSIPALSKAIAQKLLETPESSGTTAPVDTQNMTTDAEIHLKEGNLDISENLHMHLGGGEENNMIDLSAQSNADILLTLQQFILSEISMDNLGVEMNDVHMDTTNVHARPEGTSVDIDSMSTESMNFDSAEMKPTSP